jgi:hypothetical protein
VLVAVAHVGGPAISFPLNQCVHDYRPGDRCGWSGEQGRQALLDPCECTSVGLFSTPMIFEDADRRHRVIWCIDHVVGFEARDITDDRDRLLLDRESQRLRYQRGDMLVKGGWLTLSGSAESVVGAANICCAEADERGPEGRDQRIQVGGDVRARGPPVDERLPAAER